MPKGKTLGSSDSSGGTTPKAQVAGSMDELQFASPLATLCRWPEVVSSVAEFH